MHQGWGADRYRHALVDRLVRAGTVSPGPVEAALRAVPRHLFIPDVPLRRAYSDTAVVTRRGPGGELVSSMSQPTMVAIMLTQLQVRPGDRILEIGAGTGYNAALLDELVGPEGAVTTVDIEPEVAAGARAALALAGRDRVHTVCGDGAEGYEPDAPYDRLIVTAGTVDLAPAWSVQLTAAARMVVPLTVCGSTRNVALVRSARGWRSESAGSCGFIALRGMGAPAPQRIALGRRVFLRVDGGIGDARLDETLKQALLHDRPEVAWTRLTLTDGTPVDDLQLFLALTGPGGYGQLEGAVTSAHVPGARPVGDGRAIVGPDAFAYLVVRTHADGGTAVGVCGYGPGAGRLVSATARQVSRWKARHRTEMAQLTITVVPADDAGPAPPGFSVRAPHHRLYLAWPGWDEARPCP